MGQRLYEGMSLREITDYLFVEDEPAPADLIIVLGGPQAPTTRATNLFSQSLAPYVVLAGGDPGTTGIPEAEALRDICLAEGMPPEATVVENRSLTTLESVLMTVPLVEERWGWKNLNAVILVSAPHKMRRVKQVFARRIPRDVKIICCPDHVTDITRDNWWQTPEGRRRVFRELEKLRIYSRQGEL